MKIILPKINLIKYYLSLYVICAQKANEINLILFEQIERDITHWLAIIDWAKQQLVADGLIPDGYQLKFIT